MPTENDLQAINNAVWAINNSLNQIGLPQKCRNKDHGIVFYEDSQLIVENPVDNVYFNGNEKKLSTIKEYFRKSSSGLYAKVGESYGHWKL